MSDAAESVWSPRTAAANAIAVNSNNSASIRDFLSSKGYYTSGASKREESLTSKHLHTYDLADVGIRKKDRVLTIEQEIALSLEALEGPAVPDEADEEEDSWTREFFAPLPNLTYEQNHILRIKIGKEIKKKFLKIRQKHNIKMQESNLLRIFRPETNEIRKHAMERVEFIQKLNTKKLIEKLTREVAKDYIAQEEKRREWLGRLSEGLKNKKKDEDKETKNSLKANASPPSTQSSQPQPMKSWSFSSANSKAEAQARRGSVAPSHVQQLGRQLSSTEQSSVLTSNDASNNDADAALPAIQEERSSATNIQRSGSFIRQSSRLSLGSTGNHGRNIKDKLQEEEEPPVNPLGHVQIITSEAILRHAGIMSLTPNPSDPLFRKAHYADGRNLVDPHLGDLEVIDQAVPNMSLRQSISAAFSPEGSIPPPPSTPYFEVLQAAHDGSRSTDLHPNAAAAAKPKTQQHAITTNQLIRGGSKVVLNKSIAQAGNDLVAAVKATTAKQVAEFGLEFGNIPDPIEIADDMAAIRKKYEEVRKKIQREAASEDRKLNDSQVTSTEIEIAKNIPDIASANTVPWMLELAKEVASINFKNEQKTWATSRANTPRASEPSPSMKKSSKGRPPNLAIPSSGDTSMMSTPMATSKKKKGSKSKSSKNTPASKSLKSELRSELEQMRSSSQAAMATALAAANKLREESWNQLSITLDKPMEQPAVTDLDRMLAAEPQTLYPRAAAFADSDSKSRDTPRNHVSRVAAAPIPTTATTATPTTATPTTATTTTAATTPATTGNSPAVRVSQHPPAEKLQQKQMEKQSEEMDLPSNDSTEPVETFEIPAVSIPQPVVLQAGLVHQMSLQNMGPMPEEYQHIPKRYESSHSSEHHVDEKTPTTMQSHMEPLDFATSATTPSLKATPVVKTPTPSVASPAMSSSSPSSSTLSTPSRNVIVNKTRDSSAESAAPAASTTPSSTPSKKLSEATPPPSHHSNQSSNKTPASKLSTVSESLGEKPVKALNGSTNRPSLPTMDLAATTKNPLGTLSASTSRSNTARTYTSSDGSEDIAETPKPKKKTNEVPSVNEEKERTRQVDSSSSSSSKKTRSSINSNVSNNNNSSADNVTINNNIGSNNSNDAANLNMLKNASIKAKEDIRLTRLPEVPGAADVRSPVLMEKEQKPPKTPQHAPVSPTKGINTLPALVPVVVSPRAVLVRAKANNDASQYSDPRIAKQIRENPGIEDFRAVQPPPFVSLLDTASIGSSSSRPSTSRRDDSDGVPRTPQSREMTPRASSSRKTPRVYSDITKQIASSPIADLSYSK